MNFRRFIVLSCTGFVLILAACSTSDNALIRPSEGERISVLALQESLIADENRGLPPMILNEAWKNEFWPQAGGYPNHSMQHLALGSDLKQIWKTDIGEGTSDRIPLVSQPIVVNGMIVTMDSEALITAFDVNTGEKIWQQEAGLKKDDDVVISGGLAYGEQRIYATTGYNELLALDYKTGKLIWRKVLSAPSQVAPTVLSGRVYVVTLDNRLIVMKSESGDLIWEYASVGEVTGIIGGASPAVNRETVIAAFSSGELASLRVENGALSWSDNLDTVSQFGGLGSIADIKALPVIDKGLLVAVNYSGRMAAIDLRSGRRIWQRDIGSTNMPWLAGDLLFVVTSDNDLVMMHRHTGLIYWVKKLASYVDEEDRDDAIQWVGPIVAGGRVLLVNSEGEMLEVDPQNGQTLKLHDVGGSIRIAPIVAGGKMFVLSEDGTLRAYQ